MRVAFVSSSVPRHCGIATFTADLRAAVRSADPTIHCDAAAIDEPNAARAYGAEVRWRIQQDRPDSYREAARAISASNVDVVNLQHEFGLYGTWHDGSYDDHLSGFLDACTKPIVTTLHTVPPRPEPWMRDAVRRIADRSEAVVVMAATAARLLREVYGISRRASLIEHGMPTIEPSGRRRFKHQLGMDGCQLLTTFGLVDPRKGLENVVNAMPAILAAHPEAVYLIVGQTHPELRRRDGEAYRNSLVAAAERAGVSERVRFVNAYLTQREIIDHLLATDVYVTPYLDPDQVTSGTLAYALGAGKAIVSTPYLHAREVLGHGRGVLVPFRDPDAVAVAVNAILDDPLWKRRLEMRAYAYGREMAWPAIGKRVLALMEGILRAPRSLPAEVAVAVA